MKPHDIAHRVRLGAWLLLTLALCACGGGGGGGNDGMQIRFDQSSVSLTAQESVNVGQGSVNINATASGGAATDALYVGAELQGVGIVAPIAVAIDTVARTASITLTPNATLSPGTYSGTVRLLACKDPLCAAHHNGSPFTVSYTTVITPRFKVAPLNVDFVAVETVQPAAQVVQVTLPQGISSSTAALEFGAGVSPWLDLQPQGLNYTLRPNAGLAVGTYSAVLRIEASTTLLPIRIPVQHRVGAGLVLGAQTELAVQSQTPASATAGELAISVASGVSASQWQASSDQPWLQLQTATGAIGTPLRWQLQAQAFAALANQATHDAVVTVSVPGTTLAPQTWRLRLNKDVAELLGADTVAVQAGEAGEVLLYGRRLDQLAQPATQLSTTGFTPQSVSLRSASMMSLQVPALAAGSYDISLQTASGLSTRRVRLVVVAPQDRAEQWVNTTGLKGAVLWDAANQAAFIVDLSQNAVVRAQPVGSGVNQTLALSSRVVPNLAGLALSPDRRGVIATTRTGQLLLLSSDDLSTLSTQELGRPVDVQFPQHLPLMVTADQYLLATGGNQWAAPLSWDLAAQAAVPLSSSAFTFYSGPWGLVSPNGQRALVTQTAGLSPAPPLAARDAISAMLTPFSSGSSPNFFYHAASDRRGTRWLLDSQRVVDFNLNTLGLFPAPLPDGWFPLTAAMSRDGTRAYLYALNSTVSDSRIFVFDTSVAVGASQVYPLLGTIQPLLSPSCLSPTTSDTCNGYASRMVLLDDDRTLLLAGDRRMGLVPVPAGLRGGVPNAQALRAPFAVTPARR